MTIQDYEIVELVSTDGLDAVFYAPQEELEEIYTAELDQALGLA